MNKSSVDGTRRQSEAAGAIPNQLWVHRLSQVFIYAVKDFFHDSGSQWAAAIAYYSLLSTFPLLLAITSVAAFFVEQQWVIEQATSSLNRFLPTGGNQIEQTIKGAIAARGSASLLSIATLLWTGSRVFGVVTKALNIAYDTDETYSFWKRTLVELFMVLTIGVLFVAALASRFLINLFWNRLELFPQLKSPLLSVMIGVVPAFLLLLALFLLYRFVPHCSVDWRAALAGAVWAAALILVARPLFLTYVQQFAIYNLIYGSLAIVIILVIWASIVAVITLFGGEFVSHFQAIILEGKSAEEVEQRHKWRSPTHREVYDTTAHQEFRDKFPHQGQDTQERVKMTLGGQD